MFDLSAFQRDILVVIDGLDAPKGTAIQDSLDRYYETTVHHGRLYPNLKELVDRRLVAKGKKNDRTNEYTRTEKGEQRLDNRRAWEDERIGEF